MDTTEPEQTQDDAENVELLEVVEEDLPPVTAADLGIALSGRHDDDMQMLLDIVAITRSESSEYLDKWQRSAAEMDNLRKRSLREQTQVRELASERVVSSLLGVLDSFDAALSLPTDTDNEMKLLNGMAGVHAQLLDVLRREGVEPITAMGATFDPEVHDAVSAPGDGSGALTVIGELRRGYRMRTKILRAALVAVGHTEEPTAEEHTE
jgi:molecular chaperone GrpE